MVSLFGTRLKLFGRRVGQRVGGGKPKLNVLLLAFMGLTLVACVSTSSIPLLGGKRKGQIDADDHQDRQLTANKIAANAGLTAERFSINGLPLLSYHRFGTNSEANGRLVVYLEGDGKAYETRRDISPDPTPEDPLSLSLAAIDTGPNVLWIGRPCQYSDIIPLPEACEQRLWTSARYGEEVIAAINNTLSDIAKRNHFTQIDLVGWSGGGAVALLLAERRRDVVTIRTLAGNLDHVSLMQVQRVNPLTGSLNPLTDLAKIATIPQIHFGGEDDETVPPWVVKKYLELPSVNRSCTKAYIVPDAEHNDGWLEHWQKNFRTLPQCE